LPHDYGNPSFNGRKYLDIFTWAALLSNVCDLPAEMDIVLVKLGSSKQSTFSYSTLPTILAMDSRVGLACGHGASINQEHELPVSGTHLTSTSRYLQEQLLPLHRQRRKEAESTGHNN
jgi:hypothetical protein